MFVKDDKKISYCKNGRNWKRSWSKSWICNNKTFCSW
jgi:hypothetical protein